MRCFVLKTMATAVALTIFSFAISAEDTGVGKETPQSAETGEPEGTIYSFPPMKVDQRIFQFDSGWFSDVARRIEDGTATMPERRSFYLLDDRLYPYDKQIPGDWRIKALRTQKMLTPSPVYEESGAVTPSATYTWTLLGPGGLPDSPDVNSGRATAIWVDPATKNTILLGTADGGVWKTTNQGTSWTSIFDANASVSIGSIGVDPNNKQIIYVGTGEGNFSADMIAGVGMYKSTDGGTTWTLLTLPSWSMAQPYHNIRRIAVDPRDSQKVYAAIDGGLIYSTDGGTSWTPTTCGAASGTTCATDLVLDSVTPAAGSPSLVYVAFGYHRGSAANGVYRSAAGGPGPWTNISTSTNGFPTPATAIGRITLVQAPSDKKQIYALLSDVSPGYGNKGIYYCSNASAATPAWTLKNNTTTYCSSQCWYDMHGCVDPNNAAKLVVGGLDDYISTNNGATLTKVSDWAGSGTGFSHADHHFLVMPDSSTLYDANDGGFFIGTVSGTSVSWVNKNTGLSTLQFYGMAQHPTDSTKYQGGLQDNGQAYYSGTAWSQVAGGDGGWSQWDQSNASYAYEEYVYASIYRNSNMVSSPTAWTCIRNFGGCSNCSNTCIPDTTSTTRTAFIAPFALDPNNQNTMYTGSYHIYKNSAVRTGSTWTSPSTTDLTAGGYINFIHVAKNNGTSGVIYTGSSDGKFYASTNSGAAWTDRTTGISGGNRIKSIATDPANGSKVLVSFSGWDGNRVYRSADGGATWTNISGALPQIPVNSIVVDPNNTSKAYAGLDMGVYMNSDVWNSSTWVSVTGNLPPVASFQLEFCPSTGKLRTATHGRGIWELAVGAPPVKEASPSRDMKASRFGASGVSVTYTPACGASDNTVYTGDLDTLRTQGLKWDGARYCNKLNTGVLTFSPPSASSIYFVVVGNNGTQEGSYGQGTGGERPAAGAGSPCAYTQSPAGDCP